MIHRWKLSKGTVRLLPRLLAKVDADQAEWCWAIVIAEKQGKYLCLYNQYRKWLEKDKVRLL